MRRRWFTIAIPLFVVALLFSHPNDLLAADPGDNARRLVLVTGARSDIAALSTTETRKLFLGIPIEQGGRFLVPLRNQTDPVLQEVFLQKIMFMSGPMYERTLLTRLLRTKGTRPHTYESEETLLQALRADTNAVTYMWASRVEDLPDLRIIVELWRE